MREPQRLTEIIDNLQLQWQQLETRKAALQQQRVASRGVAAKKLDQSLAKLTKDQASIKRKLRYRKAQLADLPQHGTAAPDAQHQQWFTWVFGSVLLLFVIGVVFFAPESLAEYKRRLLAICAALLAGVFGFFLTGSLGVTVESIETRFGKAGVKGVGGFAAFVVVLVWWLSPLAPVGTGLDIYNVRVTVLNPQRIPVHNAKVWSSVGGEPKQVAGGWEFAIPAVQKPADGKLTVYASQETAFLCGQHTAVLGEQAHVTVTVALQKDTTASVQGIVQNTANQGIAGARVGVYGNRDLTATTDAEGHFTLPAGARQPVSKYACMWKRPDTRPSINITLPVIGR